MESRRSFIKKGLTACVAVSVTGCMPGAAAPVARPFNTNTPQRALVAWYSQTGHTRQYGQVIARELNQSGIETRACDIRQVGDKPLAPVRSHRCRHAGALLRSCQKTCGSRSAPWTGLTARPWPPLPPLAARETTSTTRPVPC